MKLPAASSYMEALQDASTCFSDPVLAAATPLVGPLGLPRAVSGNVATVFRLDGADGQSWAVRCFVRPVEDERSRYEAIAAHLSELSSTWWIPFELQPLGIRVDGDWWPIVKMPWVEGTSLIPWVEHHLWDGTALAQLAVRFAGVVEQLRADRVAHGDLQHGNVLLAPSGDLHLVDYDGMWVPALAGRPGTERGHRSYQHPGRQSTDFGPALDSFSSWMIYASLSALAADPLLWGRLDGGEEALLLREHDLADPDRSAAFAAFEASPGEGVPALGAMLRSFLGRHPAAVPPLSPANAPPPSFDDRATGSTTGPAGAPGAPMGLEERLSLFEALGGGRAPGGVPMAKANTATTPWRPAVAASTGPPAAAAAPAGPGVPAGPAASGVSPGPGVPAGPGAAAVSPGWNGGTPGAFSGPAPSAPATGARLAPGARGGVPGPASPAPGAMAGPAARPPGALPEPAAGAPAAFPAVGHPGGPAPRLGGPGGVRPAAAGPASSGVAPFADVVVPARTTLAAAAGGAVVALVLGAVLSPLLAFVGVVAVAVAAAARLRDLYEATPEAQASGQANDVLGEPRRAATAAAAAVERLAADRAAADRTGSSAAARTQSARSALRRREEEELAGIDAELEATLAALADRERDLHRSEQDARAAALVELQGRVVQEHLGHHSLTVPAAKGGVSASVVQRLALDGVRTAADFTRVELERTGAVVVATDGRRLTVGGMEAADAAAMMTWRREAEGAAQMKVPTSLPPERVAAIRVQHEVRRAALANEAEAAREVARRRAAAVRVRSEREEASIATDAAAAAVDAARRQVELDRRLITARKEAAEAQWRLSQCEREHGPVVAGDLVTFLRCVAGLPATGPTGTPLDRWLGR